jgi:hypothetical protein
VAELSSVVLEPKQAAFLRWLMDPRSTAQPEADNPALYKGNQADWAKLKRISNATLNEWKTETRFRSAWDEAIQRVSGGPERLAAFLMELTQIAVGQDPHARTADRIAAIKLHLEVVGRHSPKTVVEIRDPRLDAAQDADLLERANRHTERIRQAANAAGNVVQLRSEA